MTMSEEGPTVRSRQDLAAFIRSMRTELLERSVTWENDDLPSFLEALSAWTDDMDGYYANRGKPVPEQPSWNTFAEMLTAARVYE